MPQTGAPNNPRGSNGWDGFGTEEPYGQKTQDASLQRAAPMAGAPLASGPIAAPRRASRRAQGRGAAAPAPAPPPSVTTAPTDVSHEARTAMLWQGIAAIPGASDLVKAYAGLG